MHGQRVRANDGVHFLQEPGELEERVVRARVEDGRRRLRGQAAVEGLLALPAQQENVRLELALEKLNECPKMGFRPLLGRELGPGPRVQADVRASRGDAPGLEEGGDFGPGFFGEDEDVIVVSIVELDGLEDHPLVRFFVDLELELVVHPETHGIIRGRSEDGQVAVFVQAEAELARSGKETGQGHRAGVLVERIYGVEALALQGQGCLDV